MDRPITAIRWCRVSSDEQRREGYSLGDQDRLTREYCERENLEVVGEWLAVSESAWGKEPRPQFEAMLSFVQARRVDRIAAAKFDRVARNMPDFDRAWNAVPRLASVTEPVPPGAAGRFTAIMLAGVAEFSSNQSSDRIKSAMRSKAAAGHPPGPVPLGYRHVRTDGRDRVAQVPQEIALVRALFAEAAEGVATLDQLTAKLNLQLRALGHRTLTRSAVHGLIHNRFYIGEFQWDGKHWPGAYERAVAPEAYAAAQRGLGRAEGCYKYRRHQPPYRGLIYCRACDKPLTMGRQKGRVYAWCHRCGGATLREDRAREAFAEMVRAVYIDRDEAQEVLDKLKAITGADDQGRAAKLARLQREVGQRRTLLDRALDLHLEGKLDSATYERRSLKWQEEIATGERQIAALKGGKADGIETVAQVFKLAQRAPELFVAQDDRERRRLLDILLLNSVWDGATLTPKYRSPFDVLAERASVHDGRGDRI